MVVFGTRRPVTIVRDSGTPQEMRWETHMGGDFAREALFNAPDRVRTGYEIFCDVFDEPCVVSRVAPVFGSGEVAFWKAGITPRSEWNRLNPAVRLQAINEGLDSPKGEVVGVALRDGEELPAASSAANLTKKVRPGPMPDRATAQRVLDIVTRVAGNGPWKSKLDEICDALDEAGIPIPKTWKGIESWADAAALEKELAKKAIQYRLKIAHN